MVLFFYSIRQPPTTTLIVPLLPYTTLFRSSVSAVTTGSNWPVRARRARRLQHSIATWRRRHRSFGDRRPKRRRRRHRCSPPAPKPFARPTSARRSEAHTSELKPLMSISYAGLYQQKKKRKSHPNT